MTPNSTSPTTKVEARETRPQTRAKGEAETPRTDVMVQGVRRAVPDADDKYADVPCTD